MLLSDLCIDCISYDNICVSVVYAKYVNSFVYRIKL